MFPCTCSPVRGRLNHADFFKKCTQLNFLSSVQLSQTPTLSSVTLSQTRAPPTSIPPTSNPYGCPPQRIPSAKCAKAPATKEKCSSATYATLVGIWTASSHPSPLYQLRSRNASCTPAPPCPRLPYDTSTSPNPSLTLTLITDGKLALAVTGLSHVPILTRP